jgi:hypothetical protein
MGLEYIYNMLPKNAQTLLQAKTVGKDGAKALILSLLTSTTSTQNKWNLLNKDDITKSGESSSSGDKINVTT